MFFYLLREREVMQKPKVCRNIDIRQCFNESCDKKILDLKVYTC